MITAITTAPATQTIRIGARIDDLSTSAAPASAAMATSAERATASAVSPGA